MPIYEYECEGCGQAFELLIRGNEQASCPQCGSRKLAKQLSAPVAHSGPSGGLPVMPPGGG